MAIPSDLAEICHNCNEDNSNSTGLSPTKGTYNYNLEIFEILPIRGNLTNHGKATLKVSLEFRHAELKRLNPHRSVFQNSHPILRWEIIVFRHESLRL